MSASTAERVPPATTLEQIKQRPDAPFGLLLFRVPEAQPRAVGPNGFRLEKTSTQEPTGKTSRDGKVVDDWEPDGDNWKD
jgi:hypothetical protein